MITHMGRGLFLEGHTRPHPRGGGGVQTLPILAVRFYLCVTTTYLIVLRQNYQICRGNIGTGLVFRGQPRPYSTPVGRGPSAPLLSFPYIYAYTLCRGTTKFDMVYGEGLVLMGSASHGRLKGAEPQRSPVVGVLFYF